MITRELRYRSEEELVAGLVKAGFSPEKFKESIAHERSHYSRALSLGYKPEFSLVIKYGRDSMSARLATFLPEDVSKEDLIIIAGAPIPPSPGDLGIISALIRELSAKEARRER